MAGTIWAADPGFIPAEPQLMNPSIWGPGDPSGPPPGNPHWGLPHHPPTGPPPNPFPAPGPAQQPNFPAPHPGPFPGKSPWDGGPGPGAWHPGAPAHAHPSAPNGWGAPHNWPQHPPGQNAGHGHGHGRAGGGSMHAHSQPPNSAPPHPAPNSNPHAPNNNAFQWSNPTSFAPPGVNTANKSFAESVAPQGGGGRGVMGPGPGGIRPPFDPSQPGWGAPPGTHPNVNQEKPWNVGPPNDGAKDWDTKGTSHWGDPGPGGHPSGHHPSGWGQQPGGHGGDWQPPRDNGTGMWNQPGPGGPAHGHGHGGGGGWGGPPHHPQGPPTRGSGAHWDSGPAPSAPTNQPPNDNVWVPPGPMDGPNSDMIWHDPNPKTKKPVIDKGTGHWGDPSDSKWKDSGEDIMVSSAWAGSPLAPSGGGGGGNGANVGAPQPAKVTSSASTPAPSGWGDPPSAGADWGAPPTTIPNSGPDGWTPKSADSPAEAPTKPGLNQGLLTDNPNIRDLTAQLRVAVEKRLINMNILNQPLPQNVLLVLNNLLQRVPKLESATKELASLTASPNATSPAQQAEIQRLQLEINKLKAEIQELQGEINRSTENGTTNSGAVTPGDGGSKLSIWKPKTANSTPNLGDLADTLSGIGLNGPAGDVWGPGSKISGLDWSTKLNGDAKSETGSKKGGSATNSASATPTPDISLKEFVPGRKWEWSDPKEIAEDPNATPGSLKPNPLSVGSGLGGVNSTSNSSSFGLGGNITPTKLNHPTSASLSPSMSAGIWGGNRVVTSMAGNGHPPPVNRSVSSPVGPGGSAFAPISNALFVVLSNTGNVSEANLRAVASKINGLQNFIAHQGHQIALLKYAEQDAQILPRLQAELGQYGVKVQTAEEGQVNSLMNLVSSSGSGGRSGAPTPSQLWPDPSSSGPGPWGAPPSAQPAWPGSA